LGFQFFGHSLGDFHLLHDYGMIYVDRNDDGNGNMKGIKDRVLSDIKR
jgi:hypothetical protein